MYCLACALSLNYVCCWLNSSAWSYRGCTAHVRGERNILQVMSNKDNLVCNEDNLVFNEDNLVFNEDSIMGIGHMHIEDNFMCKEDYLLQTYIYHILMLVHTQQDIICLWLSSNK